MGPESRRWLSARGGLCCNSNDRGEAVAWGETPLSVGRPVDRRKAGPLDCVQSCDVPCRTPVCGCDARSCQLPGHLEIVPEEAAIVERIFRDYGSCLSPKAIVFALNQEKIAGQRGGDWSPSTIHGHVKLGTGILSNELYVGQRVWNRQQWSTNPDTDQRVRRLNTRRNGSGSRCRTCALSTTSYGSR